MLGKVQLNLPWITKNYEPFLNEECEDFEDLSNKYHNEQYHNNLTSRREFEIEDEEGDNNVYSLPPSASSSVCLPPNPDPPPFDVLHEPLVIESRGGKANKSPSTQGSYLKRVEINDNPLNDKQENELSNVCVKCEPVFLYLLGEKVDPFYADSLRLQKEILSPGGIEIYISAHDLLKNIAVIELENCLWIGGWNQRVLNLHNLFHLGDMLISVNGHEVNTLRQFKKTVEMTKRNAAQERQRTPDAAFNFSSEVKCWLRLRRLPLAKTLIVCRQVQDEKIGISFDDKGTNKVKSIDSDGALACTGLPALAQSFMRKSSAKSSLRFLTPRQMTSEPELVPWTATEINHRLLNPLFKKHEADLLIGARGMEISVTFQPSDFMEAICKKLRKSRLYQSFF